jgi:DNA polymerase elongation subunit (family B)
LTLFLQREYTAHGYTVCYQQADLDGYVKFKGAYTDRVAQENTVYKDVIMPDFTSLYPNSIRSMNACLTTINNNQLGRRIDLSDDDSLDVDHCHYEQTGGIMPEIITKMFDERKRT